MFMFRVCCIKVYPKKDDTIALRLNEKCQLLIHTTYRPLTALLQLIFNAINSSALAMQR